jgi:hypothetical protein
LTIAGDLARRRELWAQKGYLARAVTLNGGVHFEDPGILPPAHFVDDEAGSMLRPSRSRRIATGVSSLSSTCDGTAACVR